MFAAIGDTSEYAPLTLLQDALARSASAAGDKVALVCGAERLTYRTLDERSSALAAALVRRGVQRGDRVVLYADNTPEAVVSLWAVLKADAVVCPVNPLTKAGKLLRVIEDCQASALITDAHLYRQWGAACASAQLECVVYSGRLGDAQRAALPAAVAWEQALTEGRAGYTASRNGDTALAALLYTTGADGEPLGIMLTHAHMLAASASLGNCLELARGDVVVCALPLTSEHGLYPMLAAGLAGACVVLERSFAFPGEVLGRMAAERVTVFPAVPTMIRILGSLKDPRRYDLSAVRAVASAGAGLSADEVRLLETWFPHARIHSTYGLPECGRCACLPPGDVAEKHRSVGVALPGMTLQLVDGDGRVALPGVPGELVVSGAAVMSGYWNKPAATARKLEPKAQRLHTGALFTRDDEGYLHFVRRLDGMLECRGERVAPAEIVAVVLAIDGVRAAAAVGMPDAMLGVAVKVFVVPEPGATLTAHDVLRACVDKLENHRVPKFVEITSALPRPPSVRDHVGAAAGHHRFEIMSVRQPDIIVSRKAAMDETEIVAHAFERGTTTFMGLELYVAPGALVPRAETELLGNTAVEALQRMGAPSRAIDMCCGAGNLACAVAQHVPDARVWAADLTTPCVQIAQRNVERLGLADRVSVHQGDLFAAFDGLGLEGTIDAVVCNPPYISDKRLEGERAVLLDLEPREAFAAGPYGLGIHMRVVRDALAFLRPGGVLLFEVGLGQDRQVKILFERAREYERIAVAQNAAGESRVVLGYRKSA